MALRSYLDQFGVVTVKQIVGQEFLELGGELSDEVSHILMPLALNSPSSSKGVLVDGGVNYGEHN